MRSEPGSEETLTPTIFHCSQIASNIVPDQKDCPSRIRNGPQKVWLSSPPWTAKPASTETLFSLCALGPIFLQCWNYPGPQSIVIKLNIIRCTELSHAARRAANLLKVASCGTCYLSSLVYKRGIIVVPTSYVCCQVQMENKMAQSWHTVSAQ